MLQTIFFGAERNIVALHPKGKRVECVVPGTDPYLVAAGYTHLPGGQWSQMPCRCF